MHLPGLPQGTSTDHRGLKENYVTDFDPPVTLWHMTLSVTVGT